MKPCLVTDELSADPETAIEIAVGWGIRDFEIRGYYTDRVPCFSNYQKQRLHDVLNDYDARVVAISPGLFKFAYPEVSVPRSSLGWMDIAAYEEWDRARRELDHHQDVLLPATLEYAAELGAKIVVIFGFHRGEALPGLPSEEAIQRLRRAAGQAHAVGVQLALESEDGFWADTGARTADIVKAVDHPGLGVNWDPGNAFCAGDDPYPAGYDAVRSLIRHVHFKDARRDVNGAAHYALDGKIDWEGQIHKLAADGYNGFISIETHLRPKIAGTRFLYERLRALLKAI